MPFANIKLPQAALSRAQKEDLIHRTTAMFVDFFGEGVRPFTMVLVEEVADGGYGRADEVFVVPEVFAQRSSAELFPGEPRVSPVLRTSAGTAESCRWASSATR